jgi:hypothetical protein
MPECQCQLIVTVSNATMAVAYPLLPLTRVTRQRGIELGQQPQPDDPTAATTLYAARGRLNSNSPTGSTRTPFSTCIKTRVRIRPFSI